MTKIQVLGVGARPRPGRLGAAAGAAVAAAAAIVPWRAESVLSTSFPTVLTVLLSQGLNSTTTIVLGMGGNGGWEAPLTAMLTAFPRFAAITSPASPTFHTQPCNNPVSWTGLGHDALSFNSHVVSGPLALPLIGTRLTSYLGCHLFALSPVRCGCAAVGEAPLYQFTVVGLFGLTAKPPQDQPLLLGVENLLRHNYPC